MGQTMRVVLVLGALLGLTACGIWKSDANQGGYSSPFDAEGQDNASASERVVTKASLKRSLLTSNLR